MADGIAGARFEVIPQTGHLPNLERTAEFNRLLADFLAAT
jgi:pimeloyl-ACP methyl ester carboxylesterase